MSQTVQTHITMLVLNYVLSDSSYHRSHLCRAFRLSAPTTIRHVLRQYLVRNILYFNSPNIDIGDVREMKQRAIQYLKK